MPDLRGLSEMIGRYKALLLIASFILSIGSIGHIEADVPVSPTATLITNQGVILFSGSRDGIIKLLYTVHPDGSNLHNLTTADASWPTMSPDRNQIAFESTRNGT